MSFFNCIVTFNIKWDKRNIILIFLIHFTAESPLIKGQCLLLLR